MLSPVSFGYYDIRIQPGDVSPQAFLGLAEAAQNLSRQKGVGLVVTQQQQAVYKNGTLVKDLSGGTLTTNVLLPGAKTGATEQQYFNKARIAEAGLYPAIKATLPPVRVADWPKQVTPDRKTSLDKQARYEPASGSNAKLYA